MPVSRRDICLTLLGVLPWLPQAASAVDLVSSASRIALPPPDDDGITMMLDVGDARINLFIEGRPFELSQNQLQGWVQRSADIVADYYGSFPVEETWVAIRGARGGRVMNGQATTTSAGIVINVSVGLMATPDALADDWIMVHELIHLAFPRVLRRHHWIEEGLSVYVESIARASVGDISDDEVWAGFLDGMPKGLPGANDRGLDNTATWGRTYWGGALYALLTDIRIREHTNGEKTLRDALRAIVAAGYNMTKFADLREVLATGDDAIGVPVLVNVYDEMRDQPVPEEIDSLWINLGVANQGGKIIYNDNAPMFGIRQALTQ